MAAVSAAEKAGLHVERVDLASFALLRAASRLDEHVEAIVDIGARSTTVVVHTDDRPCDDPLYHLLVNRRAAESIPIDGLWLRLVDLPVALAALQPHPTMVTPCTDSERLIRPGA